MNGLGRVGFCIPTLNPGDGWRKWLDCFCGALPEGSRALVIDSSSSDRTVEYARDAGLEIIQIDRTEFNHGRTRQLGVDSLSDCDVIIFLTQDALLATPHSISNLLMALDDISVGAVFGRQLPHSGTTPIGAHARLFNYPDTSAVRGIEDIPRLGIKAAFISNSFAAYRRDALMAVGGFPSNTIFGEDTIVGAKMLLTGWKIAYQADAAVYHSHDYSLLEEFRRYFDIGVMHAREYWILESFGKPEGEGKRFVMGEFQYLVERAPWCIPEAGLRTLLKFLGYRMGLAEARWPLPMKRVLSMHSRYWEGAQS